MFLNFKFICLFWQLTAFIPCVAFHDLIKMQNCFRAKIYQLKWCRTQKHCLRLRQTMKIKALNTTTVTGIKMRATSPDTITCAQTSIALIFCNRYMDEETTLLVFQSSLKQQAIPTKSRRWQMPHAVQGTQVNAQRLPAKY